MLFKSLSYNFSTSCERKPCNSQKYWWIRCKGKKETNLSCRHGARVPTWGTPSPQHCISAVPPAPCGCHQPPDGGTAVTWCWCPAAGHTCVHCDCCPKQSLHCTGKHRGASRPAAILHLCTVVQSPRGQVGCKAEDDKEEPKMQRLRCQNYK